MARHGCPVGTLCTELSKRADELGPEAAAILYISGDHNPLDYDPAADLAIHKDFSTCQRSR